MRDHVWWKTMNNDLQSFCDSCVTCKRSKPSNQKPYRLLNPLEVPTAPWESIGIDFIRPLPESENRDGSFNVITVIIDLLTGMVHLVPSRTDYKAKDVAELIFEYVYKLYGLPKNIISDRDVLFTSHFWRELHKLIGVNLRMSSAYHPQSDGSTERANRTITQMIRNSISNDPRDWVARIPGIEFAINSAHSESTGYSSFFLNSGRQPRAMIWESPTKHKYPGVKKFALQMKNAIMSAHDSILEARIKQTRDANRRRREAPFEQGDLVYLSTKNLSIPKGLARKLVPKYIGPYPIIRDFGNNSFELDLPTDLKKRTVHPIFHALLLHVHIPNDDRLFPGRHHSQVGFTLKPDGEWKVRSVINHKGCGKDAEFEIGWATGDRTWMSYESITDLPALSEYFEAKGIKGVQNLKDDSDVVLQVNFVAFPVFPLSETFSETDSCDSTASHSPQSIYKAQGGFNFPHKLATSLFSHSIPLLSSSQNTSYQSTMPRKVSHDELEAQKRIDALDHLSCPSDQLLVITDLQATASFQYAYSRSQVLHIISLWRKIQAGKAPATFAYPAGANELTRVILANDKHGIGSACYLNDTNEWIVPERAIVTIDEIMIP